MNLTVLPSRLAIVKLQPYDDMPLWIHNSKSFLSITYTDEELSIVCSENVIPENFDGASEKGWCCIKIEGELDFSLTGILASLTGPLAEVGVSVFAISTFNTDYILVKTESLERALSVLDQEGNTIIQ